MKEINNKEIATSLYIINKAAKLYPIARKLIKSQLFWKWDGPLEIDFDYPKQAMELANEMAESVGLDGLEDSRFEELCRSEGKYERYLYEEYVASGNIDIEVIDEIRDTDEDCLILDEIANELTWISFSESDIEYYKDKLTDESISWLQEVAENMAYAREFYEKVDKFHELLHKTQQTSKNLYSLKQAIIKSLKLKPIGYHQNINDSDNILEFYKYEGFTFHLPLAYDELKDQICSDDLKMIDTVDGEIRLDSKDRISIEDAVKTLLSYLKIDTQKAEDILRGEYDACYALNIKKNPVYSFVRESNYRNYKDKDSYWNYYDEFGYECDDYDEYDEDDYENEYEEYDYLEKIS